MKKRIFATMVIAIAVVLVSCIKMEVFAETARITTFQNTEHQKGSVRLNKTKLTLLEGKTQKLKVINAGKKKVVWKSSKKSVATVSANGLVRAKKHGKTTITATVDGKKHSCKLVVTYKPIVSYIWDRKVQYEDNNDGFRLLFTLGDQYNKPMKTHGHIVIRIENGSDVVYTGDLSYTESDFGKWTNNATGKTSLQCSIFIPRSEVAKGMNTYGKIYYQVYALEGKDEVYFNEENLYISSLLEKTGEEMVSIAIKNTLPFEASYSIGGSLQSRCKVESIKFKPLKIGDKIFFRAVAVVEKTFDIEGVYSTDSIQVGYRILNEKGIVVESGSIFQSDLKTGDRAEVEFGSGYLEENVPYTLELIDVNY